MSSTTNIQNLLVNVFRPIITYENGVFRPRLALSNVDSITANSVYLYNLRLGDPACNVYVGSNSGNFYTDTASLKGSASNVAVGVASAFGLSNASNCVYIGYNAIQTVAGSSNNVIVGANTLGNGSSNIVLGANSRIVGGSSNILIGTGLDVSTSTTNRFYLGNGMDNITLASDLSANNLGINNPNPNSAFTLDVSGYTYIRGGLGINDDPRDYTLNVNGNFRVQNGYGLMTFDTPSTSGTYTSSGDTVITASSYTTGKKAVLDVAGIVVARDGTVSLPSYTFSNSSTSGMYSPTTNQVAITTNGTQRMNITTSNISTTVPFNVPDGSSAAPSFGFSSSTGFYRTGGLIASTVGNSTALFIRSNGISLGNIVGTGGLIELNQDAAFKPATNTWTIASDSRIKQNIESANLETCYSNVKQLQLRRFEWGQAMSETTNDKKVLGFIADEVENIFPKSIKHTQAFGYDDLKTLNSDQIYIAMFGALQKVIQDKENLEQRIARLESIIQQVS